MQITIKNVDENTFREFKAVAIRNGIKLGTALTMAIEKFKDGLQKKHYRFTAIKPTKWGRDSKRISVEIDEILYGD